MNEKQFTDLDNGFKKLTKAFQKFNQTLAKRLLLTPIPMNYEMWSRLHEIADGDDLDD